MSAGTTSDGCADLMARIDRLEAELEQAEVSREDVVAQLGQANAANTELNDRLEEEHSLRIGAERRLSELTAHPPTPAVRDRSQEDRLRDQLSVALEELQVIAEEFQLTQEELRRLQLPEIEAPARYAVGSRRAASPS